MFSKEMREVIATLVVDHGVEVARSKEQITNELVKLLDNVLNMFDNAPIDTKRVLM